MRRTILGFAVAFVLIAQTAQQAPAREPLTGTISCTAEGFLDYGRPYLPGELLEPLDRPMRISGRTDSAMCDESGVVGSPYQLYTVDARLKAKLAAGSSCLTFLDTLPLTGTVKLRWIGNKLGNPVSLGSSRATIASAAYDSVAEGWVVVTNPIKSGAFAGSVARLNFKFFTDDGTSYAELCDSEYRFSGWQFTDGNPLVIDIP